MGLKSMTGFGRAELKSKNGFIRVEFKTTNHKFLEIFSRLPGHLAEFEDGIRKGISQELRRGKVNLFISAPDPSVFVSRLVLNEALAKEVAHSVQRLKDILKLKNPGPEAREKEFILREVLRYPDVLTKDNSASERKHFFQDIQKAVALALANLARSRVFEGKALEKDFRKRLAEMEKSLKIIKHRIPVVAKEYKVNLRGKMKDFIKEGQIDSERLTLEVAQYVKNSDISEEVTRLESHIQGMRKTLNETGELGRKIDFIGQEMYREANTMGAKSSDVSIANQVIEIKSAIEKIREQAQNVE